MTPTDQGPYAGRNAVVTGGASGIGRAVTDRLAKRGCQVLVFDKTAPRSSHQNVSWIDIDLTDIGEIETAIESQDRIDYLVTAAGISGPKDIFEVEPADWDAIFKINVRSMFFLIQKTARKMPSGSAIVNVSSINGIESRNTREAPYNASKAAVISLTRTWSRALSPNTRVNCVCPGITDTPMLKSIFDKDAADLDTDASELVSDYLHRVPLRRVGAPEEIAAAIEFLLSDGASYVTGQALPVCGGVI